MTSNRLYLTVTVLLRKVATVSGSVIEIVAIADVSTGLFGTGKTTIQSTQDLQIISDEVIYDMYGIQIKLKLHPDFDGNVTPHAIA